MVARGIRNNNPGNIRRGSRWTGLSSVQSDREFCQFESMEYGIRAFFVLMRTYKNKYSLLTIEDIVFRFAPTNENSTSWYISFVCEYFRRNGFVNCDNGRYRVNIWLNSREPSEFMRLFARAVFLMETGHEFTDDEIQKGIDLI